MPQYPFKCDKCGIEVEISASIHDTVSAPRCDCGQMMTRIYEATPALFNAPGFYKTDKGK